MTHVGFGRVVGLITEKSTGADFKVGLEAIEGGTGRLLPGVEGDYDGDGIAFQPGDLLFGKLRPYLSKSWLADRRGSAVGDFHVYRAREGVEVEPRYLQYVTLSSAFLDPVVSSVYGAKMPRASWDFVRDVEVYMPDLDEQRAIADYLDHETAKIDTLIAKQERLISGLNERRDAAWSSHYERALSVAGTARLGRLVDSIVDGPFGSSLTSAHYADSGARVVRLGNIGVNEFRAEDEAYIPLEYFQQMASHEVRAGDVLIAGLGDERWPLGRACVAPELGPAIVKADCYRARPSKRIRADFLAWSLSAPQSREQFGLLSRGATRSRLNTTVVRDAFVPVPPRDAQRRILDDASADLRDIDEVISKAQRFVSLAKERRAALITAAVTGQLDVRTAA